MRRFKGLGGDEMLELGQLADEPGIYLQIGKNLAAMEPGRASGNEQFTIWLTNAQAVNLAEHLLRRARKYGEIL